MTIFFLLTEALMLCNYYTEVGFLHEKYLRKQTNKNNNKNAHKFTGMPPYHSG